MRLLPLPGVFQPHSDSLMLAGWIAEEPRVTRGRVLDLCTGSGVLAVQAARCEAAEVVAVDVSRRAVAAARVNARLNGVAVRALRGDLFAPVGSERFDVIASNPPYLPGPGTLPRRGAARAWEGGRDGRRFIDRICTQAGDHLRPEGALLLLHSAVCGVPRTLERLAAGGLRGEVLATHRGTLGPRLRARAPWLRERGLLEGEQEELVVFRAVLDRGAGG